MYHPTRGGTRGGAAEFSWDDVRKDKDRENYLGHSTLAPTGRWQNHKDVNWYNKSNIAGPSTAAEDGLSAEQAARRKELQAIKQREQEEMDRRLGRKPGLFGTGSSASVGDALLRGSVAGTERGSGANTTAVADGGRRRWGGEARGGDTEDGRDTGLTRDERRAARKLAKMEVRERRREERHARREGRRHERERHRSTSAYRSLSPADAERGEGRGDRGRVHHRSRSRSRSPPNYASRTRRGDSPEGKRERDEQDYGRGRENGRDNRDR